MSTAVTAVDKVPRGEDVEEEDGGREGAGVVLAFVLTFEEAICIKYTASVILRPFDASERKKLKILRSI